MGQFDGKSARVTGGRAAKAEPPLATDAAVHALVAAFEACTLPYANWTHRAHLAVATAYLSASSPDVALARIRECIGRYNRECGDPVGYNETITQLYIRRLAQDLRESPAAALHERVARIAAAYAPAWMYAYYTRERIWSEEAKRGWLEPDLRPLDF